MTHVFLYGTLLCPEVWDRVVPGSSYARIEATLRDHARYKLRDRSYPGLVESPGDRVRGTVRLDVTVDDLALLDRFEGSEYRRRTVNAHTRDGDLPCDTYIFLPPYRHRLSHLPWSLPEFRRTALPEFLRHYPNFPGVRS